MATDNTRRTGVAARAANIAAETALINSLVDRRIAPSLATITDRPAVVTPTSTAPVVTQIVAHRKKFDKVKLLYSWPPGQTQWVQLSWFNKNTEYREMFDSYVNSQSAGRPSE